MLYKLNLMCEDRPMNGYKSAKQNPGKTLVANFVSLMTLFLAILLISGVFFIWINLGQSLNNKL